MIKISILLGTQGDDNMKKVNDFLDFCMQTCVSPLLIILGMSVLTAFIMGIGYLFFRYFSHVALFLVNALSIICLFGLLIILICGIIGLSRFVYLKIKGEI